MTRRLDKLYLIETRYRTVAIIPAKDSFDAVSRYLAKIGFDRIYAYFCSCLMTTTTVIGTKMSNTSKYYFVATDTETIGGSVLSISSQQAASCDDIFSLVSLRDINDRLLMKPTIEEVRNCVGFSNAPECKLRKFCI